MAVTGTVAGRPQPQTTAEPAGGPFIRHAPDGRRAMYVATPGTVQNPQFIANPMVSSPGWNKGYRVQALVADGTSTTVGVVNIDAPWNYFQLVQLKDAFGLPSSSRAPGSTRRSCSSCTASSSAPTRLCRRKTCPASPRSTSRRVSAPRAAST